MKLSRYISPSLLLLPLFPSLGEATEPLDRFSNETAAVIRLKAPAESIESAATTAGAIRTEFSNIVRAGGTQIGEAIRLPSLDGVDQTEDWYVGVYTQGLTPPIVVLAIPTTDSDAVVDALPGALTAEVDESWVYYTDHPAGVPAAAASGNELRSVLSNEVSEVFDGGELSVFVNVAYLTKAFATQIQLAESQATAVIGQIGASIPKSPGMDPKAIVEMYQGLATTAFQAVRDAKSYVATVELTRTGIGVHEYAELNDGSATAAKLAGHPKGAMESLASLPSGSTFYFGLQCDMQQFMDWGWKTNAAMLGGDPEKQKQFNDIKELWKDVEFSEMSGAITIADSDDGVFQYVARAAVDPVSTIRNNMNKMMSVLGTIESYGMKQEMTYQRAAESIGDNEIDIVTVVQTFDQEVDPTGKQQQTMKLLFGEHGMQSRIAYFEDSYVQSMGGGPGAMKAAVEAAKANANHDIDATRSSLSEQANFVAYFDIANAIVNGAQIAEKLGNTPPNFDTAALADLGLDATYAGLSIATEENAVRGKVFVPATLISNIITVVEHLKQ